VVQDFDRFDLILVMDQSNVQNILGLARTEFDRRKVMLFRSFDPLSDEGASVPDPYYENNFELVLDICEAGCRGLLEKMVSNPFY
jgi:protein-tyrosine phosphatase